MNTIQSRRLFLNKLDHCDNAFFIALVNTPGWLKFIGNRNIYNTLDAQIYIQNILDNPHANYWIVRLQTNQVPIGAVSVIKRDYLDACDIGFAFLPQYTNMGYAYESASTVIELLKKDPLHPIRYATTIPENRSSIKLLNRLGFYFVKTIIPVEELLNLYELKEISE